nr:Tim21 [Starmerella bombicola]
MERTAAFAGRSIAAIRRGASFGFYTAIVLGGLGIFGVTGYYLANELLLPSSDGQLFHKAFALIEKDEHTAQLLGTRLKAHGETTNQRNVKTRPIASSRGVDRYGREHVLMQFHVDGERASGLARLDAVKDTSGHIDFRYLVLEVPGEAKHFIINKEVKPARSGGLFGIHWGPKRS